MSINVIQVQKWPHTHPPTEAELQEIMHAEGLTPHQWSNAPGDVYTTHSHPYHKIIYVVSGSIIFGFPVEGQPTILNAGDRLNLPAGIPHNAAVGKDGVVCLEAQVYP